MSQKEVITFIEKRQDFLDLLKINQGLIKLLERDGFKNISEAVGVGAK